MASKFFKTLLSGKQSKCSNEKRLGGTRLFALKESRWFTRKEFQLFENVLDFGYILELRLASENNGRNINKDSAATLEYGIVLWMNKPAGEKNQAVVLHLVNAIDKCGRRAQGTRFSTLESFWRDGTEIRINNMDDHKENHDIPAKIYKRVNQASRGFYEWENSYSFVHWCRYGNPTPMEESTKKKQVRDAVIRWGSVGASTGALLYLSRHQRQ